MSRDNKILKRHGMKYKHALIIGALFTLIVSCSPKYIQIFSTKATNTQLQDNNWVYENDTVKVTYSFWANKGVMSFAVYNKLDKPIYIDWKNSSFIYNSNKLNYWIDEQKSSLASYYGGYYYKGPLIKPGFTLNEGIQTSAATTIKPERITFLPPKSNYYRTQFYLLPVAYYKIDPKTADKILVDRVDNPNKKTTVYELNFDNINTPLKFRNFMAFSFSENSQSFFFIDNEFFLTSVKEMNAKQFTSKQSNDGTLFYININSENSIPYRKKYSKK
jgi:hypothetical protein